MRPSFLDNMGWAMAEVYGAVTDRLLINLAKYFPYIRDADEAKGSFQYQARMLAQMGQVTRESADIIAGSLDGADAALRRALEAAILDALSKEEPALRKAAKKGLLNGEGVLPVEVTPNQMQAFQAYYRQSADKLNLVNTVMLESTEDAYRATVSDVAARIGRTQSILNTSTGEVVTGVSTWNRAMHDAVARMVQNGLTGFVDHAGRRWSPEAYTAMDIRTTMFNTARAAVWERADSYGADLYQVSSHNGARPLCYPWQGKVISRSGWSGEVEDFYKNKVHVYAQSETTFGQAAGIFGVNCRHYPMTFIPGFSTLKGEPQDPEENAEAYELSQQQRAMERKLRDQKRDLAVMKAQGADEEDIRKQRDKVRATSADIEAFCDEHGLPRRRNREYTPVNATWPKEGTYDPTTFRTEQRDRMTEFFGKSLPDDALLSSQKSQDMVQSETETFAPAKSRKEAEAYATNRFAKSVNYSGMSLENMNRVNETLDKLQAKYPTNELEIISQRSMPSVMRSNYRELLINEKMLGETLTDDQKNFEKTQAIKQREIDELRAKYAGKGKIPFSVESDIKKRESELKFTRYSVQSSYDDHVGVTVIHEYGHILADQYFGMSNQERANPNYSTNWGLRGMSDRWKEAYNRAIKGEDIYSLSLYGRKNPKEFFAESFAAREMGEVLPPYVEDLFVEVIKNGKM